MQKPYIICHMMMAADGRIDCSMTEKINGVDEYYLTLNALNTPSTVSGRVTAQLEMAQPGKFSPSEGKTYGKEGFRMIDGIADATFLFDGGYKALTRDEVVEIVKESL